MIGTWHKIAIILFISSSVQNILRSQEQKIVVKLDDKHEFQEIKNFGASGCWYADPIGKNWPIAKKEKLAEMLFSTDTLQDGSPKGIGLSAWRFNIGAGTAEQGDSSGIYDRNHRVECFLDRQGRYDWTKEEGYQWFLRKAKEYKVADLIGFVNSPPVFYTKNRLGYSLQKGYTSNLGENRYEDFAAFLATVVKHFEEDGIHFTYLSPINEPQWEWRYEFGQAQQEGTPYKNDEIYRLIKILDNTFEEKHLSTRILFPEAAMLTYLTDKNVIASNQIETFWNPKSEMYLGDSKNVARIAAGHGYFTDMGDDSIYACRERIAKKTAKYDLEYWQSEYCMLGDGYKDGVENRTSLDCGLFLAKIIHYDLTVGNATAWQFWNSFEPGNAKRDTRYYLFALKPEENWLDGSFFPTYNLYALGQFSRFIRPGMRRIKVNLSTQKKDLLVSAYKDPKTKRTVVVIINYSENGHSIQLKSRHKLFKTFVTDKTHQLKYIGNSKRDQITLPSRSIYTLVSEDH